MSGKPDNHSAVRRLIEALGDGTISPADGHRLEQLLRDDVAIRQLYRNYFELQGMLIWSLRGPKAADQTIPSQHAIEPRRKIANRSVVLGHLSGWNHGVAQSPIVTTLLVATLIYGTFGFLAWNLRPEKLPGGADEDGRTVATISDAVDVKWSEAYALKKNNVAIRLGKPLKIRSGTIKLELNKGTTLVIEGPANWSVDGDNSVSLLAGKLTARVPGQAIGFTIETPTAKVVDLGTEFGVEVSEKSGDTRVHVIRGAVEVDRSAFSKAGGSLPSKKRLVAGQAIRVDRAGAGEVVLTSKASSTSRSRATDVAAIDLADIVAGGDGRGGHRDRGIDPTSGRIVLMQNDNYSLFINTLKSKEYISVDDSPFIDGVGIPDPGSGAVQLDSAKHTFEGFPKTCGSAYGPVWAGGPQPQPSSYWQIPGTFDGIIDYGTAPHSLITLIPNKLITFNLEAIRRSHPGRSLSVFRTIVGITKPKDVPQGFGSADTWVFVDGELRHGRFAFSSDHGPQAIEVSLPVSARHLTLAVTDGGNDFSCDWVLFADPRIECAADEHRPTDLNPEKVK